jgi:hypothetical protein
MGVSVVVATGSGHPRRRFMASKTSMPGTRPDIAARVVHRIAPKYLQLLPQFDAP